MFETLKLRNIRVSEEESLNENNLCLYKHITKYIKATDLTNYEKEEALQQVMDMLLQAQVEGRDKSFVVGDDYKEFCNEIYKEYRSDKSKVYIFCDYLGKYLFWLCMFIIGYLITNKFSELNTFTINLNQIFVANIFSVFLTFMTKTIQRENIHVPIDYKHRFVINPFNMNSKVESKYWLFVFTVGVIAPMLIRQLWGVDTESIFLSNGIIFITMLLISIVIVIIQFFKFSYNK